MKERWVYITIGPYMIMRKSDYPLFEKAHKLARSLTEDQIDEILAGKRHTRRSPGKRKAPENFSGCTFESTGSGISAAHPLAGHYRQDKYPPAGE